MGERDMEDRGLGERDMGDYEHDGAHQLGRRGDPDEGRHDHDDNDDHEGHEDHDDVLATTDLVALDGVVPKGGGHPVRDRVAGASLGRPLVYVLPRTNGGSEAEASGHCDMLLCFPFDLEELPDGRGYQQVTLGVRLDDETHALTLQPGPGTTTSDGARVAAFGLGQNRLRWTFRAPGRGGTLRPDGRWAQAVVRVPRTAAEVSGRLSLATVTVQPLLGGTFVRREAETPYDTRFSVKRADAWRSAAPLAHDGTLPGAWALAGNEVGAAPDGDDESGGALHGDITEGDSHGGPGSGEELPPGVRRLCLAVDIEKYSIRGNADMVRLQRVLLRTLRTACAKAGVDWERCGRQAQGDGYLLVMEPGIDEARVVPMLLEGLAEGLAKANAANAAPRYPSAAPTPGTTTPLDIRMRASLHQGIVHEADSGYAGSAVVALFRVLDSGPVRQALARTPSTQLVVAFSDTLYKDLVATGYEGLSGEGFDRAEIHVEAKDFRAVAWIHTGRRTGAGMPSSSDRS
ncbi:hypothetical protein [Streptomyces sp. NPDC093568]|uniref:hypothetical protein n=1 Tax=Streptomyces sp. NPDC093568 TaxID=3366041 RepID=UPI003815B147